MFDIIDGFICSFEGHAEEVLDLKIVTRATSLDGEMVRLATASQDGTVIIWDLLLAFVWMGIELFLSLVTPLLVQYMIALLEKSTPIPDFYSE